MGNRRHVSPAVKEEVARLSLDPGLRVSDIARETGVSENTVRRTLDKWRKKGRAAEVRPPAPKGRPSALQQRELEFLERRAREAPNMALSDLRTALHTELDVEISATTIYRTLRKMGLMYNESERCPAASQIETHDDDEEEPVPKKTFEEIDKERRMQFLAQACAPDVRTLVFIGETSWTRNIPLTAYKNYSPEGEGAETSGPSLRKWTKLRRRRPEPVLIALSYAGVLDVSISTGANAVAAFVSRVLDAMRPFPSPHSVLILDPARVQLTAALKERERDLLARNIHVIKLPPYAPDLNPLEQAGMLVRRLSLRPHTTSSAYRDAYSEEEVTGADDDDIMETLLDSLSTITPECALRWFRECGYHT